MNPSSIFWKKARLKKEIVPAQQRTTNQLVAIPQSRQSLMILSTQSKMIIEKMLLVFIKSLPAGILSYLYPIFFNETKKTIFNSNPIPFFFLTFINHMPKSGTSKHKKLKAHR